MLQISIEPQPVFVEKQLPKNVPALVLVVSSSLGRILGRASSWRLLWRAVLVLSVHTVAGAVILTLLMLSWGEQASTGVPN